MTDYKLYLIDSHGDIRSFPLSLIEKLTKYVNNENYLKIMIGLKDGRRFKLRVGVEIVWKRVYEQVERFAFVKYKQQFFAFQFYKLNK